MGLSGRMSVIACGLLAAGSMAFSTPAGATSPGGSGSTAIYQWGNARTVPALVRGLTGVVGIDAGNYGDMAIESNGTVEEWGQSWAPKGLSTVPVVRHVVQVVDGNDNYGLLEAPSGITPGTCPTDTSVWTVGLNRGSDLGIGDTSRDTYTTPQQVTTLNGLGVVQIVAASGHMMALTCRGAVYVWGGNPVGVLAMPTSDRIFKKPVLNTTISKLTGGSSSGVQLSTGSFSADILVHGKAYGWGNNNLGQCGCGSSGKAVVTPTPVQQHGVSYTAIDGGGDLADNGHTLALDAAGHAYCWGDNQQGQCGLGSTGLVRAPTQVPGLSALSQVRAGGQYSVFLGGNGSVWTCGYNARGEVGNGSTTNQLTPVHVLAHMRMISAGAGHALAAN